MTKEIPVLEVSDKEARRVVELSTADVVEAMCRLYEPIVQKGKLGNENRYGVDVLHSKSQKGLIMFHFITKDLLEVNQEFDMIALEKQGKVYIDSRMELLTMQLDAAREERQKDNAIEIRAVQNSSQFHDKKPLGQCVRDQMHGPSVILG